MCELTRIAEEIECEFSQGKRPLKDVVEALTVLDFTAVNPKSARVYPTSNLEASTKIFEDIKTKIPDIKPKDLSIITHYRLSGDLRASSDGLVPTVKVFL